MGLMTLLVLAGCDEDPDSTPFKEPAVRSSVAERRMAPEPEESEVFYNPAETPSGTFAVEMDRAGDVNGDGYVDLLVSDRGYDPTGEFSGGAAYIYYGSSSGLMADPQRVLRPGPEGLAFFGTSLAGVGDLDEDGFDDFVVGSSGDSDLEYLAGSLYLFYGSATGDFDDQRFFAEELRERTFFGEDLSRAGDVNGDGFNDLLVNSPDYREQGGSVYLLYGASSGFQAEQDTLLASDGQEDDKFGDHFEILGDLNADGFADASVGARAYDEPFENAGMLYLWLGSTDGLVEEIRLQASDILPSTFFSYARRAEDVNGDGYADFMVGTTADSTFETKNGAIYVYYGAISGVSNQEDKRFASEPEFRDIFGQIIGPAGDVDGDGFDDLLIRDSKDEPISNAGSAHVFYGSADGISEMSVRFQPKTTGYHSFGSVMIGLGDLTGDGYGDFVISSGGSGDNPNRIYFYEGRPEDFDGDGVGVFDDCDDDDETVGAPVMLWPDEDGDGYGDGAAATLSRCPDEDPGDSFVANSDDCDDSDASVSPEALEVCGDGIDNNCDGLGTSDDDEDADGLSSAAEEDLRTDPCDDDSDDDGLLDGDEVTEHLTDPLNADTDGDGMSDGDEVLAGRDPLVVEVEDDPDTAEPEDEPPPPKDPKTGCEAGCASGGLHGVGGLWMMVVGAVFWRRARLPQSSSISSTHPAEASG